MNQKFLYVIVGFLLVQNVAAAENEEAKNGNEPGQYWMALPAIAYSSDTGFGFGATGITYRNADGIEPYKYSVRIQAFATTKGRQNHYVAFDYINLAGLPLRLQAFSGVGIETNEAFCGFGMAANCYANDTDLRSEQYRYLNAFGYFTLRYGFTSKKPVLFEAVLRWHGDYYRPGTFTEYTTYDGRYLDEFIAPARAEGLDLAKGFSSVVALGVMADSRDIEANPRSGFLIDTTIRASGTWTGSSWEYYGFNADAMGYIPLTANKSLVLAGRGIVDLMFGQAPLQEIVKVASSREQRAYGGSAIGRGLQRQVIPGRIKFITQWSLRWNFYQFTVWNQRLDLGASLFGDAGYILWQWKDFENPFRIEFGIGAGVYLVWNERFVIRFQLGFSPYENWSPGIYFRLGNVF